MAWEHSYTRERATRSRSFDLVARAVLPLYATRADAVVAVGPAVADALPAGLGARTTVIANPVAAEPSPPPPRRRGLPGAAAAPSGSAPTVPTGPGAPTASATAAAPTPTVTPAAPDPPAALAPTTATAREVDPHPVRPVRLLALGGLVPVKAPHLLLDALDALRARDVAAHLDVAGDGPLLAGLRQRALDAGLDVTWHGHLPDVAPLLAQADVLVHTAVSETFGYALLEAAAAGVPVVAATTVQARHLVPRLVPGLVCARSGDALAVAVCALLERPVRQRAEQAEAAWETRRAAFDPAVLERGWRAVLGVTAPAPPS